MANDLIKELEKFSLIEEEEVVIGSKESLNHDETAKTKIDLMMVSKLLTDRPFNFEAMKRTLGAVWRLQNDMAVRMIESNLFIFKFASIADKERVVQRCPWFFDNQLLLMKEVKGEEQIAEIRFEKSPCWIRVYDVPFAKRNKRVAMEIGKFMGGLIEYDDKDPLSLKRYMRMKVLVDVRKPLRRGLEVATGVNATKWVDIKYERLGDFCYFCGRLGHIYRDCSFYTGEENNGKGTVYRYGPWLRASPLKRSRNFGVDNEKEKRVLNKLTNMKVQSTSRYEDPNAIKLGPPSMARKSLCQDATCCCKC
ncbi:hypothetical protein RDABS01_012480 [Bienertia sinuspersici]